MNLIIVLKKGHTRRACPEKYEGRGEGVGKVQRYGNGVYHDVFGMRRVGGQRRKWSEWWNEEVGRAVAEKSF